MRRIVWVFGLVATSLIAGCQDRQQRAETSTAQTTEPENITQVPTETKACYAYLSARDTIRLTIIRDGDAVSGDLLYQLAEKDRNTGTLQGQMRGDTLLATYTFQSEGVASKREVAFLKSADGLIEGYGPIRQDADKQVFTDRAALVFDDQMRLIPADCQP